MKIGSWAQINWAKCLGIALCLWVMGYFVACTAIGIYDKLKYGGY